MMEELLRGLGYQATGFLHSPDALSAFQSGPQDYDLVITDQTMPEITGSELAERLLSIRKDIPIILITGHSEVISKEHALNLGVKKFILKPVDTGELAWAIQNIFAIQNRL